MSNLETKIRAAFRADPRIHCVTFGVCTAYKSHGNFASFTNSVGQVIHGPVESADAIDAVIQLCDRVATGPTTMPGVMPGVVTR